MPLIHEIFTAQNVAGFYNGLELNVDQTLGQRLFPTRKQLGLKLSYIKGASGLPVVLKASAFDTPATLRDRISVETFSEDMPFFKEGMLVKEEDRQQLATIGQTGNQTLINTVTTAIFNDKMTLVQGALARIEAMRMRVLATGLLDVVSNGVAYNYDYNVSDANKGSATVSWGDEGADPIADILAAQEALEDLGHSADVMILTKPTFAYITNATATQDYIDPDGAKVTRKQVLNYLEEELDLQVEFKNDKFVDDDGQTKRFFPDGHVTFVPNATLGETVFGTSPAELDLTSGYDLDVEIIETGIAVTAEQLKDPVNTKTWVQMIVLPSFENLDSVYMLEVAPGV